MKFEKHIQFLKDRIDLEGALLDKLLSKKILSNRIIDEIKTRKTLHRKNEKLLEHIKSSKKEKSLLETLIEDNQKHIVNYIDNNGDYPFSDRSAGQVWLHGLMKKHPDLTISIPEATSISRAAGHNRTRVKKSSQVNKEALGATQAYGLKIWNLDEAVYNHFCDDCWPLNERENEILDVNQESLVDRIDAVDSGLIGSLYSKKVINQRQMDTIQSQSTSFEKNAKLLQILRRRSLRDYKTTISCLEETNQKHIAALLKDGGVTAELDIKLQISVAEDANTENAEKVIRDLIKNVLQSTSAEVTREALQEIPEDLREQSIHDISDMMERLNLKDARIGDSIILSFHCHEIGDLRKVKAELTRQHFEDTFSKLYGALLQTKQVKMDVKWHKKSYKQCQDYFHDEDDYGLSTEDVGELIPCEDDLSFPLSQTQLQRRVSRIASPKLCYYPAQEHVASLLIKKLKFIFSYYQNGRKVKDFEDFDFRIYTAGSRMLQEQTRRRLCEKDAECFPSNVYENSAVLKKLSKMCVKTYKATIETEKDLDDLLADAVKNPKKLLLIVADEAHFGASEGGQGRKLINTRSHEEHPNVFVILVTATPGIFFRDSTSSRIPRISVAEKQKDGEFIVVKSKDERRKKEIIDVVTGKDISKEVGPVKELHVLNWSECYESRFEKGLVVTLRVPQIFSNRREEQIWVSVEDLEDFRANDFSKYKLNRLVGKTNEDSAIPLLLRGRNNVVKITNLDESRTLVAMRSSALAKSYEVGFVPTTKLSDKALCSFKVLMDSGVDVLELEVSHDNSPLTRLKCTYAKYNFELAHATTDASKLDPSMTYQFLIDSSRNREEDEREPQYLSLNFYYNSIRNHVPEEQLIRKDKNFEDMVGQFKYTEPDHLLAAEYAYHIVLLDCMRKATPKVTSFLRFISNPTEFWKEYIDQRRSKLETMKSALRGSTNAVKPIESSCFSEFIKYTEEKAWKELQGICKRLTRQKELKQNIIDDVYEALIRYLLHANPDSFKRDMMAVKKVLERHMQDLTKNDDNFKNIFNTKKISVLCWNETFRIVSDLCQEEEENKEEQSSLNGHMKIIRASCTEMANIIYATLTLARKIANDRPNDDCFFEIIRYFHRFKLSHHETNGPNSRIWQILQPKHCANYRPLKKTLEPCHCDDYDPNNNEVACKNCSHPHHSVNTFFDLDRLPCIVIVVEMGRMGDTFPPSLNVMDLRARRPKKPSLPSLIQEVGRICRYQVKSGYDDLPYVLVASKVMEMLEDNLHKSVSFLKSAELEANSEPNTHHNRLLLVGEPQIGKTGVFLNIASQLRKLIKGPNDKYDFCELPTSQTRKRSADENSSQISEKRIKICESQTLTDRKADTPTCASEDDFQESAATSKTDNGTPPSNSEEEMSLQETNNLPSNSEEEMNLQETINLPSNSEEEITSVEAIKLTTICELPFEILEIVLKKAIIYKIKSTENLQLMQLLELCISQQNEKDKILPTIASCNLAWFEKMRTAKFKRSLQRYRKQAKPKDTQIGKPIYLEKTGLVKNEVPLKPMKVEDAIHCLVCNNIFSDPVKLPCTHAFCLECVRKAMNASEDALRCPLCFKEVFSPADSLESLPKATFLARLVEISKTSETSSNENLCDECKDAREEEQASTEIPKAVIYCDVCEQLLCKKCHQQHLRQKVLKLHSLSPLGSQQRRMTCDQHPTEPVNSYCKDCHKTLCTVCEIDKSKTHPLHECSLIRDVAGEYLERLKQDISSISGMTTKINENYIKLSEELELPQKAINRCKMQLAVVSTIRARKLYEEQMEIKKHLSLVKQFSLYSQALQNSGSDIEIVQEFDALKEKADELKEAHELLTTRPIQTVKDSLTSAELW